MRVVLFIDLASPFLYDAMILQKQATGGTVASIVRLAEELAKQKLVFVLQATASMTSVGRAAYIGTDDTNSLPQPDYIVFVRGPLFEGHWSIPAVAARYPAARLYYWSHLTIPTPWVKSVSHPRSSFRSVPYTHDDSIQSLAELFERYAVSIVGTSRFHADNLANVLGRYSQLSVDFAYNPIDEDILSRSGRPTYDQNRLIYLSAPERGLSRTLSLFAHARRHLPKLTLWVASPGYSCQKTEQSNVVDLGPLPRPLLYEHVEQSLCVLYPVTTFLECFGLVYAESNALGTPVLTSAMGSAPEILADPRQLVDCMDVDAVVERLVAWHAGDRPKVAGRREFAPAEVASRWEHLFGSCLK